MTEVESRPETSQHRGSALTDPIGLALTGIGAGATAGAFAITAGVLLLRITQPASPAPEGDQLRFFILTISVMLGPVIAAAVAMFITHRITDLWRRSVAAAISVFCAFLLSGLSAPVDIVTGAIGVAAYAALLAVACYLLIRRATIIALR